MRAMPKVSVVIISYNMKREVPRTVHSFLPPYQTGLSAGDVEILVMENGSPDPMPQDVISSWGPEVRYVKVPDASPSPADALNLGVEMARAPVVCPVIDGARMASPGLLSRSLKALQDHENAFVATVGFHLGAERQQIAALSGYDQAREDALLDSINWPENGYRLFEIAATSGSAQGAWFGAISESNAPILNKATYETIGGYDPAFNIPGGGLVNLDFFRRAVRDPGLPYLMILGEGTFHQFHGGVTTSKSVRDVESDGQTTFQRYAAQYAEIRGEPFRVERRRPVMYGTFRPEALKLSHKAMTDLLG